MRQDRKAAAIPGDLSSPEEERGVVPGRARNYKIRIDDRHVIRISDLDVQRLEDVECYLAELEDVIASIRQRYGHVRVLADLRRSPVRTQESAERLRLGNMALYRAGDRVALLVESSLLKIQLRRNLIAEYQNIFTSPEAAEMWLTAFD